MQDRDQERKLCNLIFQITKTQIKRKRNVITLSKSGLCLSTLRKSYKGTTRRCCRFFCSSNNLQSSCSIATCLPSHKHDTETMHAMVREAGVYKQRISRRLYSLTQVLDDHQTLYSSALCVDKVKSIVPGKTIKNDDRWGERPKESFLWVLDDIYIYIYIYIFLRCLLDRS